MFCNQQRKMRLMQCNLSRFKLNFTQNFLSPDLTFDVPLFDFIRWRTFWIILKLFCNVMDEIHQTNLNFQFPWKNSSKPVRKWKEAKKFRTQSFKKLKGKDVNFSVSYVRFVMMEDDPRRAWIITRIYIIC